MIDRDQQNSVLRSMDVDMSSEAIAQRIRDASELNGLGLSLAKTKPCISPYEHREEEITHGTSMVVREDSSGQE